MEGRMDRRNSKKTGSCSDLWSPISLGKRHRDMMILSSDSTLLCGWLKGMGEVHISLVNLIEEWKLGKWWYNIKDLYNNILSK